MMPTMGHGRCITWGEPFPIPVNNPHRRFCSPRCRVADWHARNDNRPDRDAVRDPGATATVSDPNAVTDTDAYPDPIAGNVQRCPHCHAPLAVIAVVVPSTAAHVRIPEPTHA